MARIQNLYVRKWRCACCGGAMTYKDRDKTRSCQCATIYAPITPEDLKNNFVEIWTGPQWEGL